VKETVLVREQLAFAFTRRNLPGDRARALEGLEALKKEGRASSETYGLIGRIHKETWKVVRDSEPARARGMLKKAIEAYRLGFEADWRDVYPGINFLTLCEASADKEALKEKRRFLPIVEFSLQMKVNRNPAAADYWDRATELELAVLNRKLDEAEDALTGALTEMRESFEGHTTADTLEMIARAWTERPEEGATRLRQIALELRQRAKGIAQEGE
jgi:hypothetical protein